MTHKKREKGQAIILIAFIMIGLIAMLGLAIDGGGLFFLKRDLQNAADAAIVAATYTNCVNGSADEMETAALKAAADNGFVNGVDGVVVNVGVMTTLPPGATGDPDDFVEVFISAPKDKFFIQVVYSGDLTVSAKAVGRCNKDVFSEYGRALVGSGACSNCAVSVSGHLVIEGGVHSNDCIGLPGSHTEDSSDPGDDWGETTAGNGTCQNAGQCPPPMPPDDSPVITFPDLYTVEQFDQVTDYYASLANATGSYFSLTAADTTIPNTTITDAKMKTGVLIYSTGNVKISWKDMNQTSYRMTIVAKGTIENGTGNFSKQIDAYLDNLTNDTTDSLLFFSARNNPSCSSSNPGIQLNSMKPGAYLYGLIYAPRAAVKISSSTYSLEGAIWSYTIEISGSDSTIIYRPDMVPTVPPNIDITSD